MIVSVFRGHTSEQAAAQPPSRAAGQDDVKKEVDKQWAALPPPALKADRMQRRVHN